MNLIDAAKLVTTTIGEYRYDYRAARTTKQAEAVFATANADFPFTLSDDDLDDLFSLMLDAEEADDIRQGSAYGPGNPNAEREAMDYLHCYTEELNRVLTDHGFTGQTYIADHFSELGV